MIDNKLAALGQPLFANASVQVSVTDGAWTYALDREWAKVVDAKEGRIRVRITEIAPEGIRTQVITPTPCRVPLGRLEPGVFALELWLRRGDGPHVLAQVLVVRAR